MCVESRKSSISETDSSLSRYESHQLKPRPRPESNVTNQVNPLIKPPPISLRRNSSASSCNTDTNEPDLISFTSPSPTTSTIGFNLDRWVCIMIYVYTWITEFSYQIINESLAKRFVDIEYKRIVFDIIDFVSYLAKIKKKLNIHYPPKKTLILLNYISTIVHTILTNIHYLTL